MATGQVVVGEVAGDGVEDAGAGGGVLHAEVVAVEDVVGRDVVQAARGVLVAVPGQDPPDDEIDDQAADGPEELGDLHELARLVGLLDDRVLAVRLHRRAGRRPDEVGASDARVPVVAEPVMDVPPHLVQDAGCPSRVGRPRAASCRRARQRRQVPPTRSRPRSVTHLRLDGPTSIHYKARPDDCGYQCLPGIGILVSKHNYKSTICPQCSRTTSRKARAMPSS